MTQKLAPLAILALALAGCAQTPVATATTEAEPAQNMCAGLNIESCTEMLTGHVSSAYDAYEAIESPSSAQTQAYDALNSLSSNWYEQCGQQEDAGNDWAYVKDDSACNRIAESITAQVLVIDPTAGP